MRIIYTKGPFPLDGGGGGDSQNPKTYRGSHQTLAND